MHFLILSVKDMDQTGAKMLLILTRVEAQNFVIPMKENGYLMASWQAWHGDF